MNGFLAASLALAVVLTAGVCPLAASSASSPDPQVSALLKALQGKRVAFVTNPTGVDNQLNQLADIVAKDPGTTLVALFGPEHGVRGNIQAGGKIADYVDPITSVPVYSLYGSRQAPTPEQLANVDVLVFDIQDVGARFYTFSWTMVNAMEAAATKGVKFIVFDRPNPINGVDVQGAPNTRDAGLCGRVWPGKPFGMATRHGMTMGEMARLVNAEWLSPKADLQVIEIPNYDRSKYFEQTGQPWVFPSPNMPTVDTAVVYPGMCVFEGTNLSEGRGTTKPFELVGAPFIDGVALAGDLNALGLPGVRFRPAWFTPTFSKFKGENCGGVQVHVTDRKSFDSIRAALHVLKAIHARYPEQTQITPRASGLMGDPELHKRILTESVEEIIASWQKNLDAFKQMREKYLIYR